jgi:uncharacterized membrane protein YccF (DUF307 family)
MTDFAAGNPPTKAVEDGGPTDGVPAVQDPHAVVMSTPPAAPVAFTQNIIVNQRKHGPGIVTRAIWYLFVGWWLTGLAIGFAWLCALSVVLLPVAYLVVAKIPTLLTLRPRSVQTDVLVAADGTITITTGGAQQHAWWIRALWFVCIGWWACGLAMVVAYALALTVLLLPVGLMVFNRIPAVMTLQRN